MKLTNIDLWRDKDIKTNIKDINKCDDVILSRNGNRVEVNVKRKYVYHSPDGFEFGYGGSGPSDLALNILSQYLYPHEAFKYHQDFKWKFVATIPREGGIIKGEDIYNYIKEKLENNNGSN